MKTERSIHLAAAAILALSIVATPAASQSTDRRPHPRPIPPPAGPVENSTTVDAQLDGSILQVRCEQRFFNHGGRLEEVEILLPVPADAVVTDGLLIADGREYRAEVLPADEARQIYEEIVRSRRDPALLELVGHGLVRLSAFPIPPGQERTVSFRYHQQLPENQGRSRVLLPIAALCGIDRVGPLELNLTVKGNDAITQIYSPSHDLTIEREGRTVARVFYAADPPDPRETLELITVRDARAVGIDLRTAEGFDEDDYFLLAVSPGWDLMSDRLNIPETMIFVLDTSGSMEGEKFEQARAALRRFLDDCSSEDRFNLIAFSDEIDPLFKNGPRRADRATKRKARAWLDSLRPGGGTAMAAALDEACRSRWEADLVLFLTDGLPTVGETEPSAITRRVSRASSDLRFFAIGVGYDVDARLLDDLARTGNGSVCYVRPGEDVAEAVTTLHRRVQHPCARDVELEIRGARVTELFPRGSRDLYAGEPLLFAGRVAPGARRATLRLRGKGPDGGRLDERWSVDFSDPELKSRSVPVLWASRKAAELIETIRREGTDNRAWKQLQELSERYGILNEEVALLAREDEPLLADRVVRAPAAGNRPRSTGGVIGRAQPQTAPPLASEESFEISRKAWDLRDAGTAKFLEQEKKEDADRVDVDGITFRLDGGTWVDSRLDADPPKGCDTIRIQAYGKTYFELVRGNPKLANWLAVGESVRILLPGIVLEVGPNGPDSIPAESIERILGAVDRH